MTGKKSEVKESSWLMNLFMLIVGGMTITLAVTYYIFQVTGVPSWWPFVGMGTLVFLLMVGSLPVGIWMFIAAFGLWKEKAWALGVSFVCLTIILVNGAYGVIMAIISDPVNFWLVWADWIAFIMVLFSAVGIIYLIATRGRYH